MSRISTFHARGVTYKVALLDEQEVETDPTLLLFRGDEEDALVTIHLTPGAPCDPDPAVDGVHITLPEEEVDS